jgi:hypothetical protein
VTLNIKTTTTVQRIALTKLTQSPVQSQVTSALPQSQPAFNDLTVNLPISATVSGPPSAASWQQLTAAAAAAAIVVMCTRQHKDVPFVIPAYTRVLVNVGNVQPAFWVEDGQQQVIIGLEQGLQLLRHLQGQEITHVV